ncbi:Hypothetical predicted protein [Pelobates cultripes]|uniref:Uncharacterized protein n=1 Tax=Pelobates cultripes TaxID=61616 RepID=A0AAD1SX53_PELCU|nr:Hypothetical predicted protein [Pelobates cultripes]
MAAVPDSPYSSSEEDYMDALDKISYTGGPAAKSPPEDLQAPATKGDIQALMKNLWAYFTADLDIIREEVAGISA